MVVRKLFMRFALSEYMPGDCQGRAHNLVLEWADMHREELLDRWSAAREGGQLSQIEPLR